MKLDISGILIENLTEIVEVFNDNRYDIFKDHEKLIMLRDDLNVWLAQQGYEN